MSRRVIRRNSRRPRRGLATVGAVAMLGAALPLAATGGPAHAEDTPGAGFTGFSSSTVATPIKLEIFEPTIPIPAVPQAELNFGYSKVLADSTSSRGRATYLWPGDAVGEGLKTIIEQLGLPPQISTPLASQGYPLQVNSGYPSGDESASQEPLPGAVMRTKATQYKTFAKNGFSSDCDVQDPLGTAGGSGSGSGSDAAADDAPTGGLGGLVSGLLGGLGGLGQTSTPQGASAAPAADGDEPDPGTDDNAASCQLPSQLAALIDLGGYVSNTSVTSSTGVGAQVTASSRAALGDVSLLGGLITMSGVSATAVSSGDGGKPMAGGEAAYGQLTVAGVKFRLGPDGAEAAGSVQSVPGLGPVNQILSRLGITIETPGRVETRDGGKLTTTTEALRVTIDTVVLRPVLQALPLKQILTPLSNALPAQAGPLKSLLLSVPDLAPKIVVHLGYATSTVETVQGITTPPIDTGDGDTGGGDPTPGGGTASAGGPGVTGAPGTDTPVAGGEPGTTGDAGTGDLPAAGPVAAGLPALFSIPGALLFGGLLGAGVIGSYFRRLGLAALGGGAACTHGLESGLPDLRKM